MSTHDSSLEATLDRLVPERTVRGDWDAVVRAAGRRASRRRVVVLAVVAAALIVVGLATAAVTTGIFDRDVTRADLDARVETVTRTMAECRAPGDCSPPRVQTVKEIVVEAADGVLFIDPDGRYIQVTPAAGVVGSESASTYWRAAAGTLEYGPESSRVEFALPDGGTRTIAWKNGQGIVDVTDRFADGTVSDMTLHSGDVVPLLPRTLDDQPYTPDKAVTVDLDLDRGEGYPLWIYPQRNEVFAGQEPWRDPRGRPSRSPTVSSPHTVSSPRRLAATRSRDARRRDMDLRAARRRYAHRRLARRRTSVTVTDHAPGGAEIGSETVSTGRQFSAG